MIVGFGHVARVGKDTGASALTRDLGFYRLSFADPLKDLALEADPLVRQMSSAVVNIGTGAANLAHAVHGLRWEGAKDTYPEVRRFLQSLGLGARKVFGENFWIDQVFSKMENGKDYVIPDVRFENEADAILAAGGLLIRIDRSGYKASGHTSETELADFDDWSAILRNDGDVREFQQAVVDYVKASDQWNQSSKSSARSSSSRSSSSGTASPQPTFEAKK